MRYNLTFVERAAFPVAMVPCRLLPADIELASIRLRNWALTREAGVGGEHFLRIELQAGVRCCLPLRRSLIAHPDTGVAVETSPGGPIVRVESVQMVSLFDELELLTRRLAPRGLRGTAEFHFGEQGMSEGSLVLPLDRISPDAPAALTVTQVPTR